jgi:WXG100 family type VII secretion target
MKVTPEQMIAAANSLDALKDQANGILQNYLNASYNVHGGGSWWGPTAGANTNTAEEIHSAQTKITTRWDNLIQVLRTEAGRYGDTEHQSAATVAGVAGTLNL